jgi:hypothetical protein
MTKAFSSLSLVILAIACGGASEVGDGTGDGGTSSGGSSNQGGSSAGKSAGGTHSTAGTSNVAGTIGVGGAIAMGGSGVGGGTVDERCPIMQPSGACSMQSEGASCQYDQFSGCLCYTQPAGIYAGFCQKVNPNCPNDIPMGGTGAGGSDPLGGTGGTAGVGGIGGFSAKIAFPGGAAGVPAPSRMTCSCSGGNWLCSYTF